MAINFSLSKMRLNVMGTWEDCIGAIDGTHVRASVPPEIQERFCGHKDGTTQNVLAAISFDLKFTYVLVRWEGSAHDSRVLNDAFARPRRFSIPEEYIDCPPENEHELFNLRYSSLRTTIERGFGGNKPSNTFKAGSFATVAYGISAKFRVECYPSFVENQLRTLRTMWSTIQTLRKKNGFGWDDNLKLITCDAKTYQEEVMEHRKHTEFLNKTIEMYDELAIVVGKDMAIGSFAKSYIDLDTQQENGDDTEIVADNGKEGVVEKGGEGEECGRIIHHRLKEIAIALKEINRGPIDYPSLYSKVMAMNSNGYSEDMLATAFDHLCETRKAARGFLAKNAKLRKLWMNSYFFTRL
ncbi:uncharacterized protein LOC142634673 [Castanea sativa]|uniref:uncharacterized protein LOC142634673 n=1 Tax=Castanea sativa TaxID=21020 RepID=UPI003F64FCEC